jgi:hypothetical protein
VGVEGFPANAINLFLVFCGQESGGESLLSREFELGKRVKVALQEKGEFQFERSVRL